jgi:peptidoglycan/xylan/chitin deacetylase (PgdA/CDA1 family)
MNLKTAAKRTIKKATGYKSRGIVILMYHRVVDVRSSIYDINISPDNFYRHMQHIQRKYRPMRLEDAASALESNSLPRKGVVVTFDDGYIDNYTNAYPILEQFQIPATIFVTSGYVSSNCEYWWEKLEYLLLNSSSLPDEFKISINGVDIDIRLPTANQEQRILTYKRVHTFLKSLRPECRSKILAHFTEYAGLGDVIRQDYRSMDSDEIVNLSRSGLIDIGAHTKNHPVLSALSEEEQYDEIVGSKAALESIIGKPVNSLAYPYGTAEDFIPQTLEIARQAGFKAACTTIRGILTKGIDPMALPRHGVGDWDLATFERNLDSYFL